MDKLQVIFRKWPKSEGGDVIAVFPEVEENFRCVASYQHVGGHAACSRGIIDHTKPATPEEYAPLLAELQSIYSRPDDPEAVELAVRKRWPGRK